MDEYYGAGRPVLPPRDELVGQDLIKHRQQLGQEVGPVSEGHSKELMLCIVDTTRLIPTNSRMVTRDVQRLNPELPLSKATDAAVCNSPGRAAIEGLLVQITYAIWEIRTGEISCNYIYDMIQNVTKLTRRDKPSEKRYGTRTPISGRLIYIQEYFGYLERLRTNVRPGTTRRVL